MRESGKRALANDLGLTENFPEKIPHATADREEMKAGILLRLEDFVEDGAEAPPKEGARKQGQYGKEQLFPEGEVLRLSQGQREQNHSRTNPTIQDRVMDCPAGWRRNSMQGGLHT